jgi:hypothetical protein
MGFPWQCIAVNHWCNSLPICGNLGCFVACCCRTLDAIKDPIDPCDSTSWRVDYPMLYAEIITSWLLLLSSLLNVLSFSVACCQDHLVYSSWDLWKPLWLICRLNKIQLIQDKITTCIGCYQYWHFRCRSAFFHQIALSEYVARIAKNRIHGLTKNSQNENLPIHTNTKVVTAG